MTEKQKRRVYKIHYNLRQKGNFVVTRKRWVIKQQIHTSPIEEKYIRELQNFGYCISDKLFFE